MDGSAALRPPQGTRPDHRLVLATRANAVRAAARLELPRAELAPPDGLTSTVNEVLGACAEARVPETDRKSWLAARRRWIKHATEEHDHLLQLPLLAVLQHRDPPVVGHAVATLKIGRTHHSPINHDTLGVGVHRGVESSHQRAQRLRRVDPQTLDSRAGRIVGSRLGRTFADNADRWPTGEGAHLRVRQIHIPNQRAWPSRAPAPQLPLRSSEGVPECLLRKFLAANASQIATSEASTTARAVTISITRRPARGLANIVPKPDAVTTWSIRSSNSCSTDAIACGIHSKPSAQIDREAATFNRCLFVAKTNDWFDPSLKDYPSTPS